MRKVPIVNCVKQLLADTDSFFGAKCPFNLLSTTKCRSFPKTAGDYNINGYLRMSCNGGWNQMRAAICDMVAVARFLNLTLVVPDLDKRSFRADPSNVGDIFNKNHFIDSLRDELWIIKRLSKKLSRALEVQPLVMPPICWSNEKYYLQQRNCQDFFTRMCRISNLQSWCQVNDVVLGTLAVHHLVVNSMSRLIIIGSRVTKRTRFYYFLYPFILMTSLHVLSTTNEVRLKIYKKGQMEDSRLPSKTGITNIRSYAQDRF